MAHATAAAGVAGPGGPLPHHATIQAAFGHHDLSGVRAHTDGAAAAAAGQLGARAYATGHDLAFASASPDLPTAAHEAAHVVQQRGGVQLKRGLGQTGDAYEQQADAVADAVVRGDSAARLLDSTAGHGGATAAGASIQLQPATAPVRGDPGPALGLTGSDDVAKLIQARASLAMASARAHEQMLKLRAAHVTAAQAAKEMVAILSGREADVALLADNHRHPRPSDAGATVRRDVLRSLAATPEAELEHQHADDTMRPVAIASLDALVGDALEIARALDDHAPELPPMIQALDRVTAAGTGLDWVRPASLADARDRKFAREACPAEENDESPRACTLTDAERGEKRQRIIKRLDDLAKVFFQECKAKSEQFQKAIDADERLAELVATTVVDLLITAATGPVGGAVATSAVRGAGSRLPAGLQKFTAELGKSLTKASLTKAPKALGADSGARDARHETIAALDALAQQFHTLVEASIDSLEALDDGELMLLEGSLAEYRTDQIAEHVRAFADAYVKQVGPIGHEPTPSLNTDGRILAARSMYRAARIALPGGRTRLALVEHVTDTPAAAKARTFGRAALVGIDRALGDTDDSLIHGATYRARQDQWVAADASEVIFIRWIDDPRMQALAAPDAIDVRAPNVRDLPFDAMLPSPMPSTSP